MKTLRSLWMAVALSAATVTGAYAQTEASADPALDLTVYNADAGSFHVNSVLVTGEQDAVLIDAQFSRAHAHRVVAEILDSGKNLTTVYVSHGDPDYYFGLEVIKAAFPQVEIYASQPTIDWINNTVEKKVAFWGPKMGTNAPDRPIIPQLLPKQGLSLEGKALEVKGLDSDYPGRSYVWIPAIKAVVGGVNVYSDLHLWVADAQSKADRQGWMTVLEGIEALQPKQVIPGHANAGAPRGLAAVNFTKDYLQRFETELDRSADSSVLIESMQGLYPDAGLGIALQIGAKVTKGEMKW
ncbi:MBL fold metallo-hydrolase [Motiliproteus coralliicola]|uniref:MBL fold metallo-hydrolase n=1 Tax=Motiliproteus coralliicola TaxID=2283196 RepID=A0A369WEW8_9GAMM|nr:MBL fold metallo-hydrolase [Motiliproteus coralliicola]RDE19843.1 MBL fold metallo-hydrolase [Motiliproteus coralliicola]